MNSSNMEMCVLSHSHFHVPCENLWVYVHRSTIPDCFTCCSKRCLDVCCSPTQWHIWKQWKQATSSNPTSHQFVLTKLGSRGSLYPKGQKTKQTTPLPPWSSLSHIPNWNFFFLKFGKLKLVPRCCTPILSLQCPGGVMSVESVFGLATIFQCFSFLFFLFWS